jgi:ferredoxin
MPEKYHIETKTALPRFYPVGKYTTVEFRENCAGSCRECVKKKCVYDIFKENYLHMSIMEEPEYLYTCNSCFRCVQECTKGIFSRALNPEYKALGDDYWTPDIIDRTWYQAHTGNIPVSGSGYRGPFVGRGFDSIWTDMSEIVRPTRDGIHGREYINTCIELSRRPDCLAFNEDGSLAVETQSILEIPLPILFRQPVFGILSRSVLTSMLKAAEKIGTMMFVDAGDIDKEIEKYEKTIIPILNRENYRGYAPLISRVRMAELTFGDDMEDTISQIKKINSGVYICVGLPLRAGIDYAEEVLKLSGSPHVDAIRVIADDNVLSLKSIPFQTKSCYSVF